MKNTVENGTMEKTAQGFKPNRHTAADCKRYINSNANRGLIRKGGNHIFTFKDRKEYADKLASGEYRRPTMKELRAELESSWGGDYRWWLRTIEAMQGGLSALRELAANAESQTRDGKEEALAPHFEEIEKILDKAHASYSASIRTIEKAALCGARGAFRRKVTV